MKNIRTTNNSWISFLFQILKDLKLIFKNSRKTKQSLLFFTLNLYDYEILSHFIEQIFENYELHLRYHIYIHISCRNRYFAYFISIHFCSKVNKFYDIEPLQITIVKGTPRRSYFSSNKQLRQISKTLLSSKFNLVIFITMTKSIELLHYKNNRLTSSFR